MSFAILISLHDAAGPVIRELIDRIPAEAPAIAGHAGELLVKERLTEADLSRPNALGGTRTHFYADAAAGTHSELVPEGALISINQVGIRQRVLGGTITPVNSKYLTIPARAEAYGHRAAEFGDLVVVFGRGGVPIALARAWQSPIRIGRPRRDGTRRIGHSDEAGGEILFWLVDSVTQQPDPSLLPSDQELVDRISSDLQAYATLLLQRAGSN
jgi:hypothetical protein